MVVITWLCKQKEPLQKAWKSKALPNKAYYADIMNSYSSCTVRAPYNTIDCSTVMFHRTTHTHTRLNLIKILNVKHSKY